MGMVRRDKVQRKGLRTETGHEMAFRADIPMEGALKRSIWKNENPRKSGAKQLNW